MKLNNKHCFLLLKNINRDLSSLGLTEPIPESIGNLTKLKTLLVEISYCILKNISIIY